ncbi:MAG: hypothetical protein GPJ24_04115 [Microcystis aeruginosa SX13-11]|nr:hypothetical protein [Microcystis aeruginosa SX13-11]
MMTNFKQKNGVTVKIINGKLFGQPKGDFDPFKQQLEKLNQEVEKVQSSFEELGQRIEQTENVKREKLIRRVELYIQYLKENCENLENLWTQRQENYAKTYQRDLKRMELLLKEQKQQLDFLENRKLLQIENKLTALKKQIPTKLLWLTFGSSLMIAIIYFCDWFDIYPFNKHPQKTKSSLVYYQLVEEDNRLKCQENCFESKTQIDF